MSAPIEQLRGEFPVLERFAYLNAGTNGPLPRSAAAAARDELDRQLADGRTAQQFARRLELSERVRGGFARVIECPPEDVALTTSTTQGINQVLLGLGLGAGDEVVTSDEEHPGLLGPLRALREARGVEVRFVPLPDLADAVGPRTKLVACSQVSWVTGRSAPAELAAVEVPVLIDAAQSVGAIPAAPADLGCTMLAASGQKWLCGPDGTGFLYVAPEFRERLAVTAPSFASMGEPDLGIEGRFHPDGRRFDCGPLSAEALAAMDASLDLLARFDPRHLQERAVRLAEQFAEGLRQIGRQVAPRGPSTLVSFHSDDPNAEREALTAAGVFLRPIPGHPLLRASVGAWNDESDLERLLAGLEPGGRPALRPGGSGDGAS